MTIWRVGMKAECIATPSVRPPWEKHIASEPCPQVGEIFVVCYAVTDFDGHWISFPEFPADCFRSKYFRPIVETKTDISLFHSILARANSDQKISDDA